MTTPATACILALDLGSSSARALLVDTHGTVIVPSEVQIDYDLTTSAAGAATVPIDTLQQAAEQCIDRVLAANQRSIIAVACDTFAGNLLGVDAAGTPLTSVFSWADTRAAPWGAQLRQQLDEARIWQRTGCPIHSAYLPARLRWLAAEQPDLYAAVAGWRTVGEYLWQQWLGQPLLSTAVASWNGLLNRQTQRWDKEWLELLDLVPTKLGLPVDARTSATGLLAAYAQRWPALAAVPWFAPIGDGIGSNLGCGATTPDAVAINLGTSGAVRIIAATVRSIPPGLWCYRVDNDRELLGGSLSNGGNVLQWALNLLRLDTTADLNALIAARQPVAHGLTVLPYLAGERSPGYADHARATISGLTLHTQPLDVAQALLEAVAFSIDSIYQQLRPLLPAEHRIILGGGACEHVPAWGQIICDTLGVPLEVTAIAEPTARGTAVLALQYLGYGPQLAAHVPPPTRRLVPDAQRHAVYRAASHQQAQLYTLLIGKRH